MLEKYYRLKVLYKNYVVLIKNGNFFEVFNKDAIVMNRIFGYKVMFYKKYLKLGFSIDLRNIVFRKLEKNNINYIIFDKELIDKVKFKRNRYEEFYFEFNKILMF